MTSHPPFERIVFDCDSTLTAVEGIDELGGAHAEEIAALTRAAMSGEMPLERVYAKRLELIAPDHDDVARVGSRYIERAVPDVKATIAALRSLGKEVRIVSGGLRFAVESFGRWLGVTDGHVHAVRVWFDPKGRFTDFDRNSPLTRNDGKREILASLPVRPTAFVGDGITDAEAKDVVDCFICYAGAVRREEVVAAADVVVDDPSFSALLPVLCTPAELDRLRRDPRHAPIVPPESGVGA